MHPSRTYNNNNNNHRTMNLPPHPPLQRRTYAAGKYSTNTTTGRTSTTSSSIDSSYNHHHPRSDRDHQYHHPYHPPPPQHHQHHRSPPPPPPPQYSSKKENGSWTNHKTRPPHHHHQQQQQQQPHPSTHQVNPTSGSETSQTGTADTGTANTTTTTSGSRPTAAATTGSRKAPPPPPLSQPPPHQPQQPQQSQSSTRRPSNSSMNSHHSHNKERGKEHCDICWGRPKKKGMTFQTCTICHVGVHNECYGILPHDIIYDKFICHACAAVGTTITGVVIDRKRMESTSPRSSPSSSVSNNPSSSSLSSPFEERTMTITQRPTACCFCSIDNGTDYYNAMHPIYHKEGKDGKHVILLPSTSTSTAPVVPSPSLPHQQNNHDDVLSESSNEWGYRFAWAHSLCCYAICSNTNTAGCVFGCTIDGSYDGDDVDNDTDNNNDDGDAPDVSIHHFVLCLKLRPTDKDTSWTKTVREYQKELKCMICGMDDKYSFRLALQCSAGDDNEDPTFRAAHTSMGRYDTCYCAMHVGCAMWGRNDVGELPNYRRVYFFPGLAKHVRDTQSTTDEATGLTTVTRIYCSLHALDLQLANLMGANITRYPEHLLPTNKDGTVSQREDTTVTTAAAATTTTTTTTLSKNNKSTSSTIGTTRTIVRYDPVRNRLGVLDPMPRPIMKSVTQRAVSSTNSNNNYNPIPINHRPNSTSITTTTTASRTVPLAAIQQNDTSQSKPSTTGSTIAAVAGSLSSLVRTIQNTNNTSTLKSAPPSLSRSWQPDPKRIRHTASKNMIIPTHLKHPQYHQSSRQSIDPVTMVTPAISTLDASGLSDCNVVNDTTVPSPANVESAIDKVETSNSESMVWMDEDNDDDDHDVVVIDDAPEEPSVTAPSKILDLQQLPPSHTHQPQPTLKAMSDDELIQHIINEIVAKEATGEYHLDRIFQDTKQHWYDHLVTFTHENVNNNNNTSPTNNTTGGSDRIDGKYTHDEFQTLWSQVMEYCLEEKFPYYSLVRYNWKDVASFGGSNPNTQENRQEYPTAESTAKNEMTNAMIVSAPRILEWETFELISLEEVKMMTATTS